MSHSMGLVSGAWACDESRIPSESFAGAGDRSRIPSEPFPGASDGSWVIYCGEAGVSDILSAGSSGSSDFYDETWVLSDSSPANTSRVSVL